MRIGIIGECPYVPSSYGKVVLWLSKGLMDQGFDVSVYCPSAPSVLTFARYMEFKHACESPEVCLDLPRPIRVWNERWACTEQGGDADIYVIYGSPYGEVEGKWVSRCSRINKPVAGYFVTESDVVPPILAKWLLHVDAVGFPTIAVSEAFMLDREVSEHHREYVIVPHGLPDYYFDVDRERILSRGLDKLGRDREKARPLIEARAKKKLIGLLAKDHPRKDVSSILVSFIRLLRSDGDAKLFLALVRSVGFPVWNLSLMINQLGLGANDVYVIDPEASDIGLTEFGILYSYSLINVLAFPTYGESFGLPPVEAGALGVPPVITSTPVTREIWGDYPLLVKSRAIMTYEGMILHETDSTDLYEKIRTALGDPDKYGLIARRVSSKYRLDVMARSFTRLAKLAEDRLGTKKPHDPEKNKYDLDNPYYQEVILNILSSGEK